VGPTAAPTDDQPRSGSQPESNQRCRARAHGRYVQLRSYATMARMVSVRRSGLWTVLGCLLVGVTAASCSASAISPPVQSSTASAPSTITTGPVVESSSPPRLGPGASVRITFPGAYALSADAVGRIDAVACGGVRGDWHGTATLEDLFIDETTKPVTWTFDSSGKANVEAGPFDYNLSSGGHYVLFLLDLSLVTASGSKAAITVDRVTAVQPGFGTEPGHQTLPPPFPVTLGQVPGC
jgi:hypothetical protein